MQWRTNANTRSKCSSRFCSGSLEIFVLLPVVLATDRYGAMEELGLAVAQVVKAQRGLCW